jgi:hypothetical protein
VKPELERVLLAMRARAERDIAPGAAQHLVSNVLAGILMSADLDGVEPTREIEAQLLARIAQDRTIRASTPSYPHEYPAHVDVHALARDLAAIWRDSR